MNKYSSMLIALGLAVSLAACGGGNNQAEKEPAGDILEPGVAQPGEGSAETGGEQPGAPTDGQAPATGEPQPAETGSSGGPPPASADIELELEGMKETRTGTLAESDNGYYLYTLPGFTFTPEEPGMDQVYMDNFPNYFMRIQVLGEEANLDEVKLNVKEELSLLDDQVVEMEDGDWSGVLNDRQAVYGARSASDEAVKVIVILDVDGQPIKFTLHLPRGEASEGAEPSFWATMNTVALTASQE